MARCRGCGKEIDWQRTTAGKMMPVDQRPFHLLARGRGTDRLVTVHGEVVAGKILRTIELGQAYDPQREAVGRMPHWATCKAASLFKDRKTSKVAEA